MAEFNEYLKIVPHPEIHKDPITGQLPPHLQGGVQAQNDVQKGERKPVYTEEMAAEFRKLYLEMEKSHASETKKSSVGKNTYFTKGGNYGSKSSEPNRYNGSKSSSKTRNTNFGHSTANQTKPNINSRKALFKNETQTSYNRNSRRIVKKPSLAKTMSDETLPLLDISEVENKILPSKLMSKFSRNDVFAKPKAIPRKKSSSSLDSSCAALKDFEETEQLCKTPKTTTQNGVLSTANLDALLKKMEEIQKDVKEIKSDIRELKKDVSLIKNHLYIKNDGSNENLENIPPSFKSTPIIERSVDNLRVKTIENNFLKKKVLFDIKENIEIENGESPVKIENLDMKNIRTPNTLVRHNSETAELQYLQLKDTPRI